MLSARYDHFVDQIIKFEVPIVNLPIPNGFSQDTKGATKICNWSRDLDDGWFTILRQVLAVSNLFTRFDLKTLALSFSKSRKDDSKFTIICGLGTVKVSNSNSNSNRNGRSEGITSRA